MQPLYYFLLILSCLIVSCDKPSTVTSVEDLQAALIDIWRNAEASSYDGLPMQLTKTKALAKDIQHIEASEKSGQGPGMKIKRSMLDDLQQLEKYIAAENKDSIIGLAHKIALQSIQLENNPTEQPLFALLSMQTTYNEISYAIHDPMFGLLEWSDFTQLLKVFQARWYNYLGLSSEESILQQYPQLKKDMHDHNKEILDGCLEELLRSLETANQEDFKLPCDDLGTALQNLIFLFAKDPF